MANSPTYKGLRVKLTPSPRVRPKRAPAVLPVPRVTQKWVADLVKSAASEAIADGLGAMESDRSAMADQFKMVLNELLGLVGDVRARDRAIDALQDEIMELRSDIQAMSDRIDGNSVQ